MKTFLVFLLLVCLVAAFIWLSLYHGEVVMFGLLSICGIGAVCFLWAIASEITKANKDGDAITD